jgi:hypothetical protein
LILEFGAEAIKSGMGKLPYRARRISQLMVCIMAEKIMTQAGKSAGCLRLESRAPALP